MREWIKRNREPIYTIVIGTAIFLFLILQPNFFNLYASSGLNEHILDYAGLLLGLVLTAYAIVFGLVPAMNIEILNADGFQKISKIFAGALYVLATIVVFSFLIFFFTGDAQRVFIVLQFLLIMNVTVLSFLLIWYLYRLLDVTKNTILRRTGS